MLTYLIGSLCIYFWLPGITNFADTCGRMQPDFECSSVCTSAHFTISPGSRTVGRASACTEGSAKTFACLEFFHAIFKVQ